MSTGQVDLLVVGDLMIDVVVHHEGPVAVDSDTAARVRFHGGGSAANTAAWAGSLGLTTRLLAAVGDDVAGEGARRDLAAVGVELVGPVVPDAITGTCVVLVGADGERTMFPDRGANAHLEASHVSEAFGEAQGTTARAAPRAVHLSGYTLLGERSRQAGIEVIAAARRAGVPVSVDASSAAPLRAIGADEFLDWIDGVDLVLANDDEVDALGGSDRILEAATALITKHGAAGATWTDGDRSATVAAVKVEAVDTTGAGDAFAAGYLVAAVSGADIDERLSRAAQVAARAVTQIGARPPVSAAGRGS